MKDANRKAMFAKMGKRGTKTIKGYYLGAEDDLRHSVLSDVFQKENGETEKNFRTQVRLIAKESGENIYEIKAKKLRRL